MAKTRWAWYAVVDEQPNQIASGKHHEKLGFYFECPGKPLENFEQGSNMM